MAKTLFGVLCFALFLSQGTPLDIQGPDECGRLPTVIPPYFAPFGPNAVDQVAPVNDDGSLGPLTLLRPFKFFDRTHNQVYINTNGGFTFTSPEGEYIPESFPLLYDTIVAYWVDIDIRENYGRIYYRQTTDITVLSNIASLHYLPSADFSALVATWHNVTYYGGGRCTEINTFQMLLISSGTASFAVFNYGPLEWFEASTSETAQAGYNSASSGNYYELPGAMSEFPNIFPDGSNVNVLGQWVFRLCPEVCCSWYLNGIVQRFDGVFEGHPNDEGNEKFVLTNSPYIPTDKCRFIAKGKFNGEGFAGISFGDGARNKHRVTFTFNERGNCMVRLQGPGHKGDTKIPPAEIQAGFEWHDPVAGGPSLRLEETDSGYTLFSLSGCGYRFHYNCNETCHFKVCLPVDEYITEGFCGPSL